MTIVSLHKTINPKKMVKWMICLLFTGETHFLALPHKPGPGYSHEVAENFLDILKKNEQYTKINKGILLCQSQVIGSTRIS